jgi:hypothetical protein
MRFPPDVAVRLTAQFDRFPILREADSRNEIIAWEWLTSAGKLVDYLEQTLLGTAKALDISRPIVRSSTLPIPPQSRGQQRILDICHAIGASVYLNSPGGMVLYDQDEFRARGVALEFLRPWSGSFASILEALMSKSEGDLAQQIKSAAAAPLSL